MATHPTDSTDARKRLEELYATRGIIRPIVGDEAEYEYIGTMRRRAVRAEEPEDER